jgi:hypothetical protein
VKRTTVLVVGTATVAACAYPPKSYPTPEPVPIQASFDDTWNAVIDHFAETLIPIATIEKASGLIVTEPFNFGRTISPDVADCGTDWIGNPAQATLVRHNVRVRGDSTGSQIRVTALFVGGGEFRCTSKGRYEHDLMSIVKFEAESTSTALHRSDRPRTQTVPVSPAVQREAVATRPAAPTSTDSGFVGSRVDQVFYRRGCAATEDIAPNNRRLFRTEQEAIAAGYRRSRVPGC